MRTQISYINPLDTENLSTNDILLLPSLGVLSSRNDAELEPFIYSAPMDTVTGYSLTKTMAELGEYPTVCRFLRDEWNQAFNDYKNNPNIFFAIGAKQKDIRILFNLLEYNKPTHQVSIAIDIAHGDSVLAHTATRLLSSNPYIGNIMSGSICTPDGAERAYDAGCTHLRVGVGPGAACTTRLMTGCGYPQLKAIYSIARRLNTEQIDLDIIADGGIKYPGDAVKYLAAGAHGIMLGSRLSNCNESSGWREDKNGIKTKQFRGQASKEFQTKHYSRNPRCPEGATGPVIRPNKSCEEIIEEFRGGVASAISYLGLTSIRELCPQNVRFVKITQAAYTEGTPHGT